MIISCTCQAPNEDFHHLHCSVRSWPYPCKACFHQSNFNQEEVKALIQTLMQSEDYQDTGADELGSQNNFNELSLEDETASNQIFGWAIKSAIKKIFNRRFRNAMFKLFKPCLCGREELVKE